MAESPGWNVFALVDGVSHTGSRIVPDRFLLEPYYAQVFDQVPNGRYVHFALRRQDQC